VGRVSNVKTLVGSGGQYQYQSQINWNPNGTVQQLVTTDTVPGGTHNGVTDSYVYDDLGRLYTATGSDSSMAQTYTYDAFGHITPSGSPFSWMPGYQSNNQYTIGGNCANGTGICYDANGNLTSDSFHFYGWDAENRLVSVDGSAITTDALGRIVEEPKGELLYAPGIGKVGVFTGQTIQLFANLPLPGGAQAVYSGGNLSHYNHPDWQGNSRIATTPTQTLFVQNEYTPFGAPYAKASRCCDLEFNSSSQDTDSGEYSATYRELHPVQGRWIQPDPAGMAAVDPTNPQTWNRYAYVLNNPLSYVDPTGLECVWDDGSFDSEFDSKTGSVGGCGSAGGTWVELGQNGNWSGQADQWNQNLVASIQAGQVGQVDVLGQDGSTYQTMYNGGQTTETVTPDATTFYSYGQPVTSVSQMIDTVLCGLCHSNNFASIFTPQQIKQFALTHGWSRDFFDPLHKNWWNGGLQLRSDDTTCSTHMAINLNASAAIGGSVGDWHVDQYNWQASPWGALGHLGEVVTGGLIVEGAMASGVGCSK
jgi:RHS repeat-associated protein